MLAVLLTFWFWLTPIMFTEDQFPSWARFLLTINPMFYVVKGYRSVLLTSSLPRLGDFAILAVAAAAVFILGGLFFRYMKRGFADVL
jgi:lipopolysaccharide transport system permease protein